MKATVTAHKDFTISQDRRPGLRRVPRASRPGHLHRHLRARPPDRRQERHARRRRQAGAATSISRSSAIPAATSSPPITGKTASARANSARPGSISPGTPPTATPSASTNSPTGATTVGTEMMLAINLGSRGLDEARNFLEYVNHPGGSYWGDLRNKNGRAEPFDVKLWCLGNEMDGPWQVGHKTADEYGRLADETAKAMRAFDKSLELIVCGSSQCRHADLSRLGAHRARAHLRAGRSHLAAHVLRQPRQEHRQLPGAEREARRLYRHRRLDHRLRQGQEALQAATSTSRFDEWNVWYHSNKQDRAILDGNERLAACAAPARRHLQFRGRAAGRLILNTFIRRSDVVKIACIAQLVNVIAPIMTDQGRPAWRQTIYYPYYFASVFGRGTALQLRSTRRATTPTWPTTCPMSTSRACTTRKTAR